MKNYEILAPAGDLKCAEVALDSGADAIYLGLSAFSARASAANFDGENLKKIIAKAHVLGAKVYVALNTLVKDDEMQSFVENAKDVIKLGADAIIIQDIFLGARIKQHCPQAEIHLSTQAGTNNVHGANLAKKFGVSRVILARETPIKEIEKIAKIIETEVFIQGALCTCFSGNCYFSSFAGGNSGNRGRCKQPCRKLYSIDRAGFEDMSYKLSLSDLSVGENIKRLLEAGVYSFKIEGRLRSEEYISSSIRYYKNILKNCATKEDLSLLKRSYNRGDYTKGLSFGQDKKFLSRDVQGHIGEYVGEISFDKGKVYCVSDESFSKGDCFKILRNNKEVCGAYFLENVKGGFTLSAKQRLLRGDKVYITTDSSLSSKLNISQKKRKITLEINAVEGENMKVSFDGETFISSFICESAKNAPAKAEQIEENFKKVDDMPFEVSCSVSIDGNIFIAKSLLNSFRRDVFEKIYRRLSAREVEIEDFKIESQPVALEKDKTAIIATDFSFLDKEEYICILKPQNYADTDMIKRQVELIKQKGMESYLYLPSYFSGEDEEVVNGYISLFDGIYGEGYYSIEYSRIHAKKLFAGTGMNIFNAVSCEGAMQFAQRVALSKELTRYEQAKISKNAYVLSMGNLKLMDLCYCTFSTTCSTCDRRDIYRLTDEKGRKFYARRYTFGGKCRFEIYNCFDLLTEEAASNIYDFTLYPTEKIKKILSCSSHGEIKAILGEVTSGHSRSETL